MSGIGQAIVQYNHPTTLTVPVPRQIALGLQSDWTHVPHLTFLLHKTYQYNLSITSLFMPSNTSTSPPKRRTQRSSSSSSLVPPVMTTAHVRRLSRVPSTSIHPSASTHSLSRLAQHYSFALTPDSEPDVFPPQPIRAPDLSDHPLSLQRLGATVDSLIRPPAKGKPPRPKDPPALFVLFTVFLAIFVLLIIVLRSFFPSASTSALAFNARHVRDNLNRVEHNLPPRQFWPLPDSQTRVSHPTPRPLFSNTSIDRIWQTRYLSARNAPHPLRISVVAACKDRTAFLQTALPGWLKILHPVHDEVILVDWATSIPDYVPLSEVVRATPDVRLAVVTLSHRAPWALSRAYNLAFTLARGEWLLKLDCDTLVRPSFLNLHPLPGDGSNTFYRFDWRDAKTPNDRHLNGIFLARTHDIRAIHGYDERITTYGWEDTDLYRRLQTGREGALPPLKPVSIKGEAVHHMVHDDALRGADQHLDMGPLLQTQVNSQAAEALTPWSSVGEERRTRFLFNIHSRDARFLSAAVAHAPTPLLEEVDAKRRDVIVTEAANRVLHDVYGLPWSAFDEIDHTREDLVRALTIASGRPARAEGVAGVVFAVVQGTVPDRVVAVASILSYIKIMRRVLFLTWGGGCVSSRDGVAPCKVSEFIKLEKEDTPADIPLPVEAVAKNRMPVPPIFQIGQWKCKDALQDCVEGDPAYGNMVEYQSSGGRLLHDDDVKAAQKALADFRVSVDGKRNLFLRLQGSFPLVSLTNLHESIRSLRMSQAVEDYIQQVGDVSDHVGLYISSVRQKGIEGIVRRVQEDRKTDQVYFVTGSSPDSVAQVREQLQASAAVHKAMSEADVRGSSEEARETVRQIGELMLLARCKEVLNEGRPPPAVTLTVYALRKDRQKATGSL